MKACKKCASNKTRATRAINDRRKYEAAVRVLLQQLALKNVNPAYNWSRGEIRKKMFLEKKRIFEELGIKKNSQGGLFWRKRKWMNQKSLRKNQ